MEDSSGVLKVSSFSGITQRTLVRKGNDNAYIENPRSISLRHIVDQEHQDGNENTEEAVLYWSDTGLRAISSVDVITTNRSVTRVEISNLRNIIAKTRYMPYAVQFVSMNGHRKGGELRKEGGRERQREGKSSRGSERGLRS